MKKTLLVAILVTTLSSYAQIGIGTSTPAPSSILDLTSSTKGVLLPRMTNVQKNAILSPEVGLVVWCSDCGSTGLMQVYNGTAWTNMNGVVTSLPSSNGTAVISAITCNTASAGTMTEGIAVSGVTQTITATVTTVGTYNFSTTANGVTFAASGTFAGTGNQNIVLTASGTPITFGNFNYSLNSTPSCSFIKEAQIINITSTTGKIWMVKNLGATRVAQSKDDYLAYGHLYQWGRGNDGHADITWTSATAGTPVNGTTTTLSTTDYPADNLFILQPASPYDWRATQNDNLWQGVAGINNPCPAGYRLPTITELTSEVTAYSITNSASAFASPLKFTVPGYRSGVNGTLNGVGSYGYYWSSSVSGTSASYHYFIAGGSYTGNRSRAGGLTVRCLKD